MRLRPLRSLLTTLALAPAVGAAQPPAPSSPPVEVMVVGVYHMGNPGRDLHNLQVDDVLAPKRQGEIAAVTDALARFRPTTVAVEWPKDTTAARYARYLAGTLAPSRNEVVQLGFRLAKRAGATTVAGIDTDGDFPYDAVKTYADAHGLATLLDTANAAIARMVAEQGRLIAERGTAATLRYLNDPARLTSDNGFYRTMLRVGAGAEQPGADLLTAWYRRNFVICANLVQLTRPGDRVVMFYGSGHAFLLRQCVAETPGLRLVEPNDYLPR